VVHADLQQAKARIAKGFFNAFVLAPHVCIQSTKGTSVRICSAMSRKPLCGKLVHKRQQRGADADRLARQRSHLLSGSRPFGRKLWQEALVVQQDILNRSSIHTKLVAS
jgi:hypothetical protein